MKQVSELSEIKKDKERFICESLANLKSPPEIVKIWTEAFPHKEKLSLQLIYYYERTRRDLIETMRIQILEGSLNIPIAQERIRLSRNEELYQTASKILNSRDKVLTSLSCLREAREETKGEAGGTYVQFNQFNQLTDEQLLDKKKQIENKILELSKRGDTYGKEQSI